MLLLALACSDYGIGHGSDPPGLGPRPVELYEYVEGGDADVVIVLDVSRSMEAELRALDRDADEVWAALDTPSLRVAMATTDSVLSAPLLDVDGLVWLDGDTPLEATRFFFDRATLRAVGHHAFRWQALQALERATWRPDAARHLIFVTDDDDGTLAELSLPSFLRDLDRFGATAHAIAPAYDDQCEGTIDAATQVLTYVDHTGGIQADPCDAPLAPTIASIARGLVQEQRVFPIERAPVPDTLSVRVSTVAGTDRITEEVGAQYVESLGAVVLDQPAQRGQEVRISFWVE